MDGRWLALQNMIDYTFHTIVYNIQSCRNRETISRQPGGVTQDLRHAGDPFDTG
jgi:hypothetical protein